MLKEPETFKPSGYILIIIKVQMKEKVQTLQDFGEILHEVRSEMRYATDHLASDLKASKSLFGGV